MKPARLARKSGEKQFVVDINFVLCYLVKSVISRFPLATENGWERELEMYYSAIGILAVFVLFIENMDEDKAALKAYLSSKPSPSESDSI